MDREETPKERTDRLRAEMRRKILAHEAISRANKGRNQFSLGHKLRVSLPFFVLVITLYYGSIIYVKKRRWLGLQDTEDESPAEVPEKFDSRSLFDEYRMIDDTEVDPELLSDDNKRW